MLRLPDFDRQGIANLAWAFAALLFPHPPLLDALADEAMARLSAPGADWAPQHLASTAWAFAKLSCNHSPLMAAISASSRSTIGQFAPRGLSMTAWAVAV